MPNKPQEAVKVLYEAERTIGTLRLQLQEFQDEPYLDLRLWVERDGSLIPTKKGITLPLETFQQVIEAAKGLPND